MTAVYNGLTTLIGIIIGVLVSVAADYLKRINQYKRDLQTLDYELKNDVHKIDGWLEMTKEYRDKINGDRITDFYGYYNLSTALFGTSLKLFNQGALYSILDYEAIDGMQQCWNFFSIYSENYINNMITNHKQTFANNRAFYDKTNALRDVDYIENKLKTAKKDLLRIIDKIEKN